MNTNIITPRLAKVVGSKTKTSFALIKKDRGALHSITMGLAIAVVVASVAPALAFDGNAIQMASLTEDMVTATEGYPNAGGNHVSTYPSTPPSYYSVMPHLMTGRSVATRSDRIRYRHSGTRGREGLGASPRHPEGPGNVSD
jgi:hypothetical protein